MNPNIRVLFFAHPRSGSSSLYQILQLHPELNILEEPFNENFTGWNSNNKNYRELINDIPSLDIQAAEILPTLMELKCSIISFLTISLSTCCNGSIAKSFFFGEEIFYSQSFPC